MAIYFHEEDLPSDVGFADGPIAVDTEAMGLVPGRDRLCLVQFPTAMATSTSSGSARQRLFGPNLKAVAERPRALEALPFRPLRRRHHPGLSRIVAAPLYCTRTASRLVRTYTDRHGLKDLVKELLNIDLSKAAADQRLGCRRSVRRAARLCRERRPLSPCAEGEAR